jgi:hypothetical protein
VISREKRLEDLQAQVEQLKKDKEVNQLFTVTSEMYQSINAMNVSIMSAVVSIAPMARTAGCDASVGTRGTSIARLRVNPTRKLWLPMAPL